MKYWNSRHWQNWEKIVHCLQASLAVSNSAKEEPIEALTSALPDTPELPEVPEVLDYSDITGISETPDEATSPATDAAAEIQAEPAEEGVDPSEGATVADAIGALFSDASDQATDSRTQEPEADFDDAPKPVKEAVPTLRSAAYFSQIPWESIARAQPEKVAEIPQQKSATHEKSPSVSPSKPKEVVKNDAPAHYFFKSIPWDAAELHADADEDEEVLRISVSSGSADAGLDITESAVSGGNMLAAGLRSAAKTSDRAANAPALSHNSRRFFKAIPW